MFEHFSTPEDLFEYQLGSALTMEEDSLAMLRELEMASQSTTIKELFAHHRGETEHQIENLERAFQILGKQPGGAPSAATKGLMKEGASLIAKSDKSLVDSVALSAALGTEHFEISAYQSLCTAAEALGETGVQDLLQQNLDEEKRASEELAQTARKLVLTGL